MALAALAGGGPCAGADLGVGGVDLRLPEIFGGVKAVELVLKVADARRFVGLGSASAVSEAAPAQAQAGIDKPLTSQVGLQQWPGARGCSGVDDKHIVIAVDADFEPALGHLGIPLFPQRIEVQMRAGCLVLGLQP